MHIYSQYTYVQRIKNIIIISVSSAEMSKNQASSSLVKAPTSLFKPTQACVCVYPAAKGKIFGGEEVDWKLCL